MTKKYFCSICNYETDRLSSYKDHIKSKKHLNKNAKNAMEKLNFSPNIAEKAKFFCKHCNTMALFNLCY